jgi:hypothetical protein
MLLYVVERREISSEEVVQNHMAVSRGRVHNNKLAGMDKVAFIADC